MKILIKTFLFSSFIFSQYPADSLLSLPDNSISQKIFLYPIAKWQGISYGNNAMNCQFFPSCSNYGAQAIHEKGVISGLAITSDRIIRCNHAAYKVHNKMGGKFYKDGRLIDHVNYTVLEKSKKSPIIAVGLSMAVPGLGRAYAGRPKDAAFGFLMSALAINAGVKSIKGESFFSPLYIGIALTFYSGEVYGAYRTAKYYQPKIND
jgi:putative component of membrane protein insertase Oxa1/YidC/SpoIIIJ protein YidD|tara:strand:- start:846 stop:1463 length:618 start_codon:yes stop_codon:yes gene_type:complete